MPQITRKKRAKLAPFVCSNKSAYILFLITIKTEISIGKQQLIQSSLNYTSNRLMTVYLFNFHSFISNITIQLLDVIFFVFKNVTNSSKSRANK
jgi:hypothetical protein